MECWLRLTSNDKESVREWERKKERKNLYCTTKSSCTSKLFFWARNNGNQWTTITQFMVCLLRIFNLKHFGTNIYLTVKTKHIFNVYIYSTLSTLVRKRVWRLRSELRIPPLAAMFLGFLHRWFLVSCWFVFRKPLQVIYIFRFV